MACIDCNCGRREREEEMLSDGLTPPSGCGPISSSEKEEFDFSCPPLNYDIRDREEFLNAYLSILDIFQSLIDYNFAPLELADISITAVRERIFAYIKEDIANNFANEKIYLALEESREILESNLEIITKENQELRYENEDLASRIEEIRSHMDKTGYELANALNELQESKEVIKELEKQLVRTLGSPEGMQDYFEIERKGLKQENEELKEKVRIMEQENLLISKQLNTIIEKSPPEKKSRMKDGKT